MEVISGRLVKRASLVTFALQVRTALTAAGRAEAAAHFRCRVRALAAGAGGGRPAELGLDGQGRGHVRSALPLYLVLRQDLRAVRLVQAGQLGRFGGRGVALRFQRHSVYGRFTVVLVVASVVFGGRGHALGDASGTGFLGRLLLQALLITKTQRPQPS